MISSLVEDETKKEDGSGCNQIETKQDSRTEDTCGRGFASFRNSNIAVKFGWAKRTDCNQLHSARNYRKSKNLVGDGSQHTDYGKSQFKLGWAKRTDCDKKNSMIQGTGKTCGKRSHLHFDVL
ncbi:unnamed protein product [Caenorhabditis auriculariae]|uniref:Uncharacterized protein n=1 Tax=Caenorhabditis auriculariae TaxID=2777116 RepID=A0A8S1H0T3_9PELO|nr:unnamed protein product [Caenorhabditis auriculariae]